MSKYKFNFNEAVERISELYDTSYITFVDGKTPSAEAEINQWLSNNGYTNIDTYEHTYYSLGAYCKTTDKGLVIIGKNQSSYKNLSSEKKLFFSFAHESGHVILKHTDEMREELKTHNFAENSADIFAACLGLREGILTPDDIEQISQQRAINLLTLGDVEHLSVTTLDTLPNKINISYEEILNSVQQHVKKFSLSNNDLSTLRNIFKNNSELTDIEKITQLFNNKNNSFDTKYIGTKISDEIIKSKKPLRI